MPTEYSTSNAGRATAASYGSVNSVKGARAGDSGYFDELKTNQDKEAFRKEKGWSGIAGAGKAPKGAEFDRQFAEWRQAKATKTGQQKALESQ
jgi:hypothetical protein